jgi:anti-sigma factor RsiW
MNCQEVREEAAVALLTGDAWNTRVDEHLATCWECRGEVERMRETSELLLLAPPPATVEPPDDLLLQRTLTKVAKERRRRRALVVLGVAASLLLVIPAVVWSVANSDSGDSSGSTVATVVNATASDPETGVKGTMQIRPSVSGSELAVRVNGVASGTRCNLVVVNRSGQRMVVDSWTASYRGNASVTTQTSTPTSQVGRVELVDDSSGDRLLTFELT